MAAGQAELPQAAGQVPLQPTPVNTQPTAQASSPTGDPPAPAAPTEVSHLPHYLSVFQDWSVSAVREVTSYEFIPRFSN